MTETAFPQQQGPSLHRLIQMALESKTRMNKDIIVNDT